MIWKNPFLSKNSEQQMREEKFLELFDSTALDIIEPENFERVSFVSSSPGAGKTSLFRAFSPGVMSKLVSPDLRDDYKGIRGKMTRLGLIKEGKVLLASAILSCARGYAIIDEMFQNGRKKQVFFALLNYRIVIAMLKSIGHLLDLTSDDYDRIQFARIPQEMISDEEHFKNGKVLYKWACQGERELCRYLDSERTDSIEISFVHTTVLLLKLFEAENILFDGEVYFQNTLVIFDDYHKLSEMQRYSLSESIYTLKANTGVWFGQRLEGIKNEHLISMDGSLNRDYNPNIIIDNYWPEKSKQFYNMVGEIADRRIKEASKEASLARYQEIADCLSEKREISKYTAKLKKYCATEKQRISFDSEASCRYENILSFIEKSMEKDAWEEAIWFQCIAIQQNRRHTGQIALYFGEKTVLDEFKRFVEEQRDVATYYLCIKLGIPFYYGLNTLKILSSYNVEQFLYFAGACFDCCRIKSLERRKGKKQLTAEEQEKTIKDAVKQKWNDMDYRYANIEAIKILLDHIAQICIKSRDAERAAYAGGAYTGIGIDKAVLLKGLENPLYTKIVELLAFCLSSKYLERREINNGSTVVFYLNRWLCVYYGLPLAYGGWARCSMDRLFQPFSIAHEENQLELGVFL